MSMATNLHPYPETAILSDQMSRRVQAPKVLAVWTRDRNASAATGRGRIAAAIRLVLENHLTSHHFQLKHAFDSQRRLGLLFLAGELARTVGHRRPLPLQCLLYTPRSQRADLVRAINEARPDVIYVDGIRAAPFLSAIREAAPSARLVLDMDDLMSRRWSLWQRAGIGLSFGFIEPYIPAWARRAAAFDTLARRLTRFEIRALRNLELDVGASADVVVFTSVHEAALYARMLRRAKHRLPKSVAIGPPLSAARPVAWDGGGGVRFTFVGTDRLPQNRLTIEYLVNLWERARPRAELVLVGRLSREYPSVPNVTYAGFVEGLEKVYTPGTVLLAPSFVRGGVKTKVAEAFAHGCPVVGNASTFEGICLPPGYPFVLSLGGIERLVADPTSLGTFASAARLGLEIVQRQRTDGFDACWLRVLDAAGPVGVRQQQRSAQRAGLLSAATVDSPAADPARNHRGEPDRVVGDFESHRTGIEVHREVA